GNVQAPQRGRTVVPAPEGLPAHLLALREAGRDVPRLPELRARGRRTSWFVLTRPSLGKPPRRATEFRFTPARFGIHTPQAGGPPGSRTRHQRIMSPLL